MKERDRLQELLNNAEAGEPFLQTHSGQYGRGYVPKHYKRCTIPEERREKYAVDGAVELLSAFGMTPYYTQALITGAVLSGDYDDFAIVTSSQYGKSFLMGRLALLLARNGRSVNVAAATADKTTIIMRHCLRAASGAAPDIKQVLSGDSLKKIDKLDTSLSKARLSFPGKGDVQALTLGGMYNDLDHNQAVGRGGVYIIDEAAQVPPESLAEVSRREFSSVDGKTEPLIMISNPHKKGIFYDRITASDDELMLTPTRCVIWMDARTAVEEGRWTADKVMMSDFAKNRDTCLRYLLCELPQDGDAMFPVPKHIGDDVVFDDSDIIFMGIDSAYKGKDKIQIVILREHGENVYVTDAEEIDISGREWIDGVTAEGIIEEVSRIYHKMRCSFACIDIAYAIWLFEGMIAHGCMVHSVNFQSKPTQSRKDEGHYAAKYAANKRAEMHLDLQDLMDNNAIYFDKKIADDISDTLGALHIIRKDDMRVLITPKPEVKAIIGHSPDLFDAILLAIHAYLIYNFDGYRYA